MIVDSLQCWTTAIKGKCCVSGFLVRQHYGTSIDGHDRDSHEWTNAATIGPTRPGRSYSLRLASFQQMLGEQETKYPE